MQCVHRHQDRPDCAADYGHGKRARHRDCADSGVHQSGPELLDLPRCDRTARAAEKATQNIKDGNLDFTVEPAAWRRLMTSARTLRRAYPAERDGGGKSRV